MKRAACILLVKNGQFLAVTRRNCTTWGLPGGKVDEGENDVDAVLRETFEETGLQINPVALTTLYAGWCPPANGPKGDGKYFWTTTYLVNVDIDTSTAKKQEPGIEVLWKPMSEFGSNDDAFKVYNARVLENYYLARNPAFHTEPAFSV